MTVTVITISDRASAGVYEDLSGLEIEKILKVRLPDVDIRRALVPDEKEAILKALDSAGESDFIFTTGGTGISPKDITPEATAEFCDRELPGIAEIIRMESYRETPFSMLSRGYAGMRGNTIVVNFPGSVKAVRLCANVLAPIMEHALAMVRGKGH